MKFKLVLIDDEADLCDIFKELLDSDEVEVETFSTADEILNYFKENTCDLLVMDYRLIGTNGDILAQELNNSVPKVLATGEFDLKPKYNFHKVITKPYDFQEIEKLIEEVKNVK